MNYKTIEKDQVLMAQPGSPIKLVGIDHGQAKVVALNDMTSTLVVHFAGHTYSIGNRNSMLASGYSPAHMVVYEFEAHPHLMDYFALYEKARWNTGRAGGD